jgi:hypothetical protein
MKRRDFVKGLAAAPLAMIAPKMDALINTPSNATLEDGAASHDPVPQTGNPYRLNVVVHGMFAIVLDQKSKLGAEPMAYLRAPAVDAAYHSYRAQAFKPDPNFPNYGVLPVWDHDYVVNIANTSDAVNFSRNGPSGLKLKLGDPVRMTVNFTNKKVTSGYWNVSLPLPDDVWPLRSTEYNYFLDDTTNNPTGTYHIDNMFLEQQCPITYILTYQLSSNAVTFGNTKLPIPFPDGVGRLHVYAEPTVDPAQRDPTDKATTAKVKQHLTTALAALDGLFDRPLSLAFSPDSQPDTALGFVPANDSWFDPAIHPGVLPCEQLSLAERLAMPAGTKCLDHLLRMGRKTIAEQYADYIRLKEKVKQFQEQSLAAGVRLTADPTKPPRNCMSLLAIQT